MNLNDAGLPLPGRDFDEWIAEHVLGWKRIHGVLIPPWMIRTIERRLGQIAVDGYDMCPTRCPVPDCPEVSTTHAFFQAKEAKKEWLWEFAERKETLEAVLLRGTQMPLADIYVKWADYPDQEHAYAHAVCCCAWKAMGGEEEE